MIKVIANNRNKKDFQSMTFETDLSWNELKEAFINKADISKHIFKGNMCGRGSSYPKFCNRVQVLIDDDIHFSIKYDNFTNKSFPDYYTTIELYKI